MKISETTGQVVNDIKKFSGNKLKNEQDISILIEASGTEDNKLLFKDLVFTAKYLNGLGKIIHSNRTKTIKAGVDSEKINENAEEKIKIEFKQNMLKLNSQLSNLIKVISDKDKKLFEEKYFSMNQNSLVNLTNLIYDLSWVKTYMNSKK